MDKLIRRKGIIKGQLTRLANYVNSNGDQLNYDDLRTRCDNVHKLYTEFIATEDAIFDIDSQVPSDMDIIDDQYYAIIPKLQSLIRAKSGVHQTATHEQIDSSVIVNPSSDFKLPSLTMPTFDGDVKDWQSFYDIFSSTVHENVSLSPAQKFKYLKGLLKGNAYNLVSHLRVDDANYIEAVQRLVKRYDKKKPIVEAHIKSFIEQPKVTKATAAQLVAFHDNIDEVVRGLKSLGKEAEARDPWLIFMAVDRLDEETRRAWRYHTADDDFPTLQGFLDFLLNRVDALTEVKSTIRKPDGKSQQSSKVLHVETTTTPCIVCNVERHRLYECGRFKSMSLSDRRQLLKEKQRCFNCFGDNHTVYQCRSRKTCRICKRRHHTLVHLPPDEDKVNIQPAITEMTIADSQPSTSKVYTASTKETVVNYVDTTNAILPTILIELQDKYKNWHVIRGLLDSGSTRSFIKESFVNRYNLIKTNARVVVTGLGGAKAGTTKGSTTLTIRSRVNRNFTCHIEALIVTKLTSHLPTNPVNVTIKDEISLADPTFNKPGTIDVLIGSDLFFEIIKDGKLLLDQPNLIAQNTCFGWIVAGGYSSQGQSSITEQKVYLTENQEVDVDKTLRLFWETESIPLANINTPEELDSIRHYIDTVQVKNGRITVALPFKRIPPLLGHSYNVALRQFYTLEKRLQSNKTLQMEYIQFMREYQQLGHMALIPHNEFKKAADQTFYLPHHGVYKGSNPAKLRVVFNGSQKTSTGQSLNDELLVGPTVQQGLFEILIRYRKHQFVFSADIEKMYRQVLVRKEDTDFQRILWRESPELPLQQYRLLTVTYGTSSAPFLATYSLTYVANELCNRHPSTAEILKSDIYVDDLITGANTLNDALMLRNELIDILDSVGFKLRKWSANHPQLLDKIVDTNFQTMDREFTTGETVVSILGLYYQPSRDVFKFRISIPATTAATKRSLLSESSRIFDPLGWLSPVMIPIKIMFQHLWLEKLDWDDELPDSCRNKWMRVRNDLCAIEELEIERWLHSVDMLEIHGFSDASKDAYAAVLYSRTVTSSRKVCINIITAKTKVAPIKTVSIPKLELCAATLLVRLMEKVTTALKFKSIPKQFYYTDASIVLDWLSKPPKIWPTYIANRTGLILSYSNRNQWHHVQSKENPADRATRGVSPSELKFDNLWWKGPLWLSSEPLLIPEANFVAASDPEEPKSYLIQDVNGFEQQLDGMISRVSKYPIILRIIARIQRYLHNALKSTIPKICGSITIDELNNAEGYIIKYVQFQEFRADVDSIRAGKYLNKGKLAKLYPFLDSRGILRVSGRLTNSPLNYDTQHPIILPSTHVLVEKMLQHFHRKLMHAGLSQMAGYVKQRFHIIRGKHILKKIINLCVRCHRFKKRCQNQLMGQLPSSRVNFIRPFIQSGVDYAGPYRIKAHQMRSSRVIKGYLSIFTCMATKAIHIELVTNLSTESFIAALRRFQASRGICTDLYSDNATNFIGAINYLEELRKLFLSEQFSRRVDTWTAEQGTKWHLIPPAAPHFGGLWEAAVKSTKFHLKRVIGDTILTYEELLTVLKEIEAILNSRPLCRTDDSDDPLTPAHFIIGHPLTLIPEPSLLNRTLNSLSRWQMLQNLVQQFWRRWHDEYLTTLNQLNKVVKPVNQLKINDVVILKEDNTPPARWPLARILELHPGRDSLVRVVTVKTGTSTFKRPITKICMLPSIDSCESKAAE